MESNNLPATPTPMTIQPAQRTPSGQIDPDTLDPILRLLIVAIRIHDKRQIRTLAKYIKATEDETRILMQHPDLQHCLQNNTEVTLSPSELDAHLSDIVMNARRASSKIAAANLLYKRRGLIHEDGPKTIVINPIFDKYKQPK